MPTSQDYMEFVYDQIDEKWNKRYRKMFGECMFYINEKPVLLVCDNTIYVKKMDCIRELFQEEITGYPYRGAREHYIVDAEDRELLNRIIDKLEKVIQVPVKKSKKKLTE